MSRAKAVPIVIRESWPDIPGHIGRTTTHSAKRRAVAAGGRYWLVRRRGLFRRWRWLPARGAYISLYMVEG